MSAQHTPGPWIATLDGDWWMVLTEAPHAIDEEESRQIPVVDLYHGGYDYSTFDLGSLPANARLIAAAPELLTALEDFDNWFAGFNPEDQASRMDGRKVVIRARAAIAKATGAAS